MKNVNFLFVLNIQSFLKCSTKFNIKAFLSKVCYQKHVTIQNATFYCLTKIVFCIEFIDLENAWSNSTLGTEFHMNDGGDGPAV